MLTVSPIDKIPLRYGTRALVLNPPEGYLESLREAAQGVELLRRPPVRRASCEVVELAEDGPTGCAGRTPTRRAVLDRLPPPPG